MNSKLIKLRSLLIEHGIDAILISSITNIAYITGFTGFDTYDRNAFVLITKNSQFIFTHGIYREQVKKEISDFTLISITRESPISQSIKELFEVSQIQKVGIETHDLTSAEYLNLIKQNDNLKLIDVRLVEQLRAVKDKEEIQNLSKACELTDKSFTYMLKKIKKGISERTLSAELEYYIKKTLESEVSFETVIAFEKNASRPHHTPTQQKLDTGMLVLLDFGNRYNAYCSDMTRTVSYGPASDYKKRVYKTVLEAQLRAIEFIEQKLQNHAPITAVDVDKVARDYIVSAGFPNMPHSLGHGIGLNVHEAPRITNVSKDILLNNMVFSIEPGIYIPGAFGVRIEDLFTISDNKLIKLTKSPVNLLEI